MKIILIAMISCLVLSGCDNSKKEKISWFDSENDAIQYGLKEEGINKKDIISKVDIGGELFLVYKKEEDNQLLVGLSNIANMNNKYGWYRNDSYVEIKDDLNISLTTKSLTGNEYIFHTGISGGRDITIKTSLGDISPQVDEETGIYYLVIKYIPSIH